MKRIFLTLSLLYIATIIISSALYGQSYQTFSSELDQVTKRAKWRLGPFRIVPAINFSNIGYDDNVYYQRQEEAPVSDYTGTVSLPVKVYVLFRNWLILSFTETPSYMFYFKEKRERALNNSFSPAFKLLFLNRFVISGNYSYGQQRRRASSEFDVRADELVKGYGGRIFYETARGTSFGISGSVSSISYEDITLPGQEIGLSRSLNRKERNANFEFYYRIFSESSFFITCGYTEYSFAFSESQWRNAQSYQIYSGIRFPLLRTVRGTLSLGYKTLMPETGDRKGFSGIVGNTGLDFRIWRFGFRINYTRDTQFSYYESNVYFIEDLYGGGLSFYLTRFLRVDYNYSYGKSTYPEPMPLRMPDGSVVDILREDIYKDQSVGFVFRIIRNTGVGIMVHFWERESNYFWENRARTFVGGYVTYEF